MKSYYAAMVRFRTGDDCMRACKEMRRLNGLLSETEAAYHEAAVRLGLSDSAMQILYLLADREGSCPLRDVSAQTGISKQTVHSAIRRLADDGVLTVEASGARKKRLRLTPRGERLAERTAARLIAAENRIFAAWRPEEVRQYIALTARYLEDFRREIRTLERGGDL